MNVTTCLLALTLLQTPPVWELENPLQPLPEMTSRFSGDFSSLPFPVTPERVRLGRWLFFDARLSGDGKVSCASCHRPGAGFSDSVPRSVGVRAQKGRRKSQPLMNVAWLPPYFWDGRAGSLREQAKGPLVDPHEMGNTHAKVVSTLRAIPGYRMAFRQAFGDERIDIDRVADALSAYQATLLSQGSAWDRYLETRDPQEVSPLVRRGSELFLHRGGCGACHPPSNGLFTDLEFHNLGIGWDDTKAQRSHDEQAGFADKGRYEVTRKKTDLGAFKTPSLRDVSRRAPYMHDGSLKSLEEVIDFYDRGGRPNPWQSPLMQPLGLSADEKEALVAFLRALDGTGPVDPGPRTFPQ